MKAMILAVEVIEMVQESAAKPHSKASREGDLAERRIASGIAAPFTLPPR